jgi:hypothetical protein
VSCLLHQLHSVGMQAERLLLALREKKEFAEALLSGRRAYRGFKKQGPACKSQCKEVLQLLVQVCKSDGKQSEADAYVAVLHEQYPEGATQTGNLSSTHQEVKGNQNPYFKIHRKPNYNIGKSKDVEVPPRSGITPSAAPARKTKRQDKETDLESESDEEELNDEEKDQPAISNNFKNLKKEDLRLQANRTMSLWQRVALSSPEQNEREEIVSRLIWESARDKALAIIENRANRGYAFSQYDESQARILQAYDTTLERGRYGEMTSSRPSQG